MYYTKEEVKKFIDDSIVEIEAAGLQPLIPESEAYGNLKKGEDVVGFMWIDFKQNEVEKLKDMEMKGKTFLKIGEDLYTDDRYALDLHQANLQGLTVEEVVTGRAKAQKDAKKHLSPESVENVRKALENKKNSE